MSKPKSVKVRIAVAVDADGAFGVCPVYPRMHSEAQAIEEAQIDLDNVGGSGRNAIYIVTVDAPLPPPPQTLPAKVTKVKRSA